MVYHVLCWTSLRGEGRREGGGEEKGGRRGERGEERRKGGGEEKGGEEEKGGGGREAGRRGEKGEERRKGEKKRKGGGEEKGGKRKFCCDAQIDETPGGGGSHKMWKQYELVIAEYYFSAHLLTIAGFYRPQVPLLMSCPSFTIFSHY